jgi:uncharacterized protein (UPF0147 family)
MEITYRSTPISGSFVPESQVDSVDGFEVKKFDDVLYLVKANKEKIKLVPETKTAQDVINLFSSDPANTETIYGVEAADGKVAIVIHQFSGKPIKLIDPHDQMNLYVERGTAAKLCEELNIPENQLVDWLTKQFMSNKSVFAVKDLNFQWNKFTLVGGDYLARVQMERDGVYCINRFFHIKNFGQIPTQIYGNVKFVLWDEAISINCPKGKGLTDGKIPDLIKAWDDYINYRLESLQKKQENYGAIPFDSVDLTDGVSIKIHVKSDSPLSINQLFANGEEIDARIHDLDSKIEEDPFYLNKPTAIDDKESVVSFGLRDLGKAMKFFDALDGGFLVLSTFSLKLEQKRKNEIVDTVKSKTSNTMNQIMRLMDEDVQDTTIPTNYLPLDAEALQAMLGKKDAQLTETYKRAMDIAINTPDIAIIQGPPGTGKTTLIRGIMSRLQSIRPNCKILISAQQHDALDNAVNGIKPNDAFPAVIASKRFDSTEEEETARQEKAVRAFQELMLEKCDAILDGQTSKGFTDYVEDAIYCIQKIRVANYTDASILENLPNLTNALNQIGLGADTALALSELKLAVEGSKATEEETPLQKAIAAQRTSKKSFSDDGPAQLNALQRELILDHPDRLIDSSLKANLLSNPTDKDFEEYVNYVNQLKDEFVPHTAGFVMTKAERISDALKLIEVRIDERTKSYSKSFYDIIDELKSRFKEPETAIQAVRNYSSIVGSTCAQASKIVKYINLPQKLTDYVIIDEAARANPIELINPILNGVKVILVGDQNQLPQYLESQAVDDYEEHGGHLSSTYSRFLGKSFFGILFSNLSHAYSNGQIKAQRTIMLNEQHRMNPEIGSFISNEFYQGEIINAEDTKAKVNNFGLFDGHSTVFVDVPITVDKGESGGKGRPLYRVGEINVILETMSRLFMKNPGKPLEIGVISYYKGQADRIRDEVHKRFSEETLKNVEINTVDSFQGKEFDIVLLSCARSNNIPNVRNSLGFLYESPNRINVSLSRAKRLLVVVGDSQTLKRSEPIRDYVEYVKKEGDYVTD